MATGYVYKIIDTRHSDIVLYVGQTSNFRVRKSQWKRNNIFWIKECGEFFEISIIDTTTLDKIRDCETHWIYKLKPKHNVLMNSIVWQKISTVSPEDRLVYDAEYHATVAFHRAVKAHAPEAEIDLLRDDRNTKFVIAEMRRAMRSDV